MRKFEFILKTRYNERQPFEVKYRSVCDERSYDYVLAKFKECERQGKNNAVLLVNELDEQGEFVQIII